MEHTLAIVAHSQDTYSSILLLDLLPLWRMPFNFLALPPEIRCIIYSALFVPTRPVLLYPPDPSRDQTPYWSFKPNFSCGLKLFQTCSRIHEEASAILYERNTFLISHETRKNKAWEYKIHVWLYRFINDIGPTNRRRSLHIELDIDFLPDQILFENRITHGYLNMTLATLWTVCALKTLTVKFYFPVTPSGSYTSGFKPFEFKYMLREDNRSTSIVEQTDKISSLFPNGDWRGLAQLKLELGASIQAIEHNELTKRP